MNWNGETLTLPVKHINLVLIKVVKAFIREVLIVTFQMSSLVVSNLPLLNVVEEMVVSQTVVVEEIHKQNVVIHPSADNVRIWKSLDWHCVVVDV